MTMGARDREYEAKPAGGTEPSAVAATYGAYARPRTAELLRAIGLDVVYHRAEGDDLFYSDPSGREVRVLDMLGGFGATLFGHNHPALVSALCTGVRSGLPTHAQASTRRFAALLAERLSARAGRVTGRSYVVTLSNSGTEAMEAALKHAEMEALARAQQVLDDQRRKVALARAELAAGGTSLAPGVPVDAAHCPDYFERLKRQVEDACSRPPVAVALVHGFHGKTLGSLRMTHNRLFRTPWERPGLSTFVDVDDDDALEQVVASHSCDFDAIDFDDRGRVTVSRRRRVAITGFFMEPIQGEGGVRVLPPAFLERARRLADETGVPLVFDEIQCGMGRAGTFFASEQAGVHGDYYVLAKSLGGGLSKLGATLVPVERYQHEFGYLHTSTFAEDDPGCTVALAALDLLEADGDALIGACAAKGRDLLARLDGLKDRYPDVIRDVRGRGLMVGVELAPQPHHPSTMVRLLSEQNLLGFVLSGYLLHEEQIRVAPTLSAHGTIRLEPSAYVSAAALERLCSALARFCEIMRDGDVASLFSSCVRSEPDRPQLVRPVRAVSSVTPEAKEAAASSVGFLAHFRTGRDVKHFDPAFEAYPADACEEFISRVSPVLRPFSLARRLVKSPTGAATMVHIIGVPFTADEASAALRARTTSHLVARVRAGVEFARSEGATIVGCGGYTSILTDNCRDLADEDLGVTSGNSLTVAASFEALARAAGELGLRRRVVGVVGATGNIGAALADLASEFADAVVLVGRPAAARRLERIASKLHARTTVATDLSALRECNVVVSASNSPRPIIFPEHLATTPLVLCDVAVPRDVDESVVRERPDARIIRGGIVRLPMGQTLDVAALDLPKGHVYACLGETILLGLAARRENFSLGPVRPDRVREILSVAKRHSFVIDVEDWNPCLLG
jgi:acetylornithine/succinyldiaminopimelate/putrescine aminotransferase/predicted amino acid dehydrogenase